MGTLAAGLQAQSKIPGFMPNLFEVSIFGEDSTGQPSNSFKDAYVNTDNAAVYYCLSYELPSPTFTFKRNPLNKDFYVTKYASPETVTINWQENQNLDVWKYHQEWLACFYNRAKDQFVSTPAGKKRNAHITVQQFAGYDTKTTEGVVATAHPFDFDLQELITIKLIGLVPQSIPSLKGDWNSDASASAPLSIKYYVDYIAITKGTSFYEAQ